MGLGRRAGVALSTGLLLLRPSLPPLLLLLLLLALMRAVNARAGDVRRRTSPGLQEAVHAACDGTRHMSASNTARVARCSLISPRTEGEKAAVRL